MKVSDSRALIAPWALLSLGATWHITPETIASLREEPPAPGDTVLFADGRYAGLWRVNSQDVTYRAEGDGAVVEAIYLQPDARDNRFDRLRNPARRCTSVSPSGSREHIPRRHRARQSTHGFLFRA